jgi:peptide/nickel transport system substrate-binding protein
MKRRTAFAFAMAAAALLLPASGGARAVKEGGTFRVAVFADFFDGIDPALSGLAADPFLRAACAGLMTTPDRALPEGLRVVPEVATAYPKIADGGKTYVFTIRKGVRFSNGEPVTARSFAYTLNRLLNPTLYSGAAAAFKAIVGAQAVLDGKSKTASGVVAHRNTLVIRLKRRAGNLLAHLAAGAGGFCVVPESLPVDPEGVKAPLPSAGPYYVSEYVPGQHVVLARNRFYRGDRPHHVDQIVGELTALSGAPTTSLFDRVESGELDVAIVGMEPDQQEEFKRRYGVNRSRFFVVPATALRLFLLNTEGPLFRNNVKLRQAVNFAIDRRAIMREAGRVSGYLTDQYLPPGLPGFRNERIYPLTHPDLARARALAKGHLRGGKAVLYTIDEPQNLAQAQILQKNLKAIGLTLEIKAFPNFVLFQKLATRGEPFDIGRIRFFSTRPDPEILNDSFDGRGIGQPDNSNWSYFNSPKYNRRLAAASRLPSGPERYRTYGQLDVDIARNAAPAIAVAYDNALTFVSKRTGCVVVNPNLDLAAVCLK